MKTDPLKLRIGKALRQVRKHNNVDGTELARRLGKLPAQIYRWERGEAAPGIDQVYRYLEALESSFSAFGYALDSESETAGSTRLMEIAEELQALADRVAPPVR